MRKVILLSSLLGFANPVFSADWILVARSDKHTNSYIDNESIEYSNASGIVNVWMMQDGYERPYLNKITASNKLKVAYYCKSKQRKLIFAVFYDNTGNLIDNIDLTSSSMEYIVPGTAEDMIFKAICTNPPQIISQYEQPEDAAQAAYESSAAIAFAATVAAFLAQPENQIFKEGSPEYNVLNDQVIYLQTNQPDLDSGTLLEKARKATAAIIDIPPVPEKRSVPRATPRPAVKPIPQRQRTPESRPIVNRL